MAAGAWIKVFPRLHRTAAVPPSPHQRARAALLSCGSTAVLSHRTAAWLHGLDGFDPPATIEVIMAPGTRCRSCEGLTIHFSSRMQEADRVQMGPWRLTSAARTIIDLSAAVSRRDLENGMDSALRKRLVTIPELQQRHRERRGRGSRLLDLVLDGQPSGGLHTRLERAFLQLSRKAGLPDPICQLVLRTGSTFLARVDFRYPTLALVVEVSGHRTHSSRQDRAHDARRQRALVAAGFVVVEFTSDELRTLHRDARNFRSA